jgi:hypothetical protein
MTFDLAAPATFSACRRYRYLLRRDIDMLAGRIVVSVGYNPSIADAAINDPTIRREIDFCKRWGASILLKVNAFAAVATDPDDLAAMEDPVGPLNDEAIRAAAVYCADHNGILLAAWGTPKGKAVTKRLAVERFRQLRSLGLPFQALRLTDGGYPEHPLYLPKTLTPTGLI